LDVNAAPGRGAAIEAYIMAEDSTDGVRFTLNKRTKMSVPGHDRRMLVEWSTYEYVWFFIINHGVIKDTFLFNERGCHCQSCERKNRGNIQAHF